MRSRSGLVALLVAALVGWACLPAATPTDPARPSALPKVAFESGPPTPVPAGTVPPASVAPEPSEPPAATIGEAVLVDDRQLLTVVRVEEWHGHQPNPSARFIAVLVEVEGVVGAPYNANLFVVDTGDDRSRVASDGRKPKFAFGQRLDPGETYRGWLTFSVPHECRCVLQYSLPIGQGQRSEPVAIRLDAIGPATDDPASTPRPIDPANLAGIGPDFFGPGVRLSTYEITGRTPLQLEDSIASNGPRIAWIGRAAAATQVLPRFDFTRRGSGSSCRIVATGPQPIRLEFAVILPEWKMPSNASTTTAEWWTETLRELAIHERTHVEIYREGLDVLNRIVSSSTCAELQERLEDAWAEINLEQCEFDMREYGDEFGLELEDCLEGLA